MNSDTVPQHEHIGTRLKICRIRRGMGLEDLERLSGVNRSTISRIENGPCNVSLFTFVTLCQALDVSPVEILCGDVNWNAKGVHL